MNHMLKMPNREISKSTQKNLKTYKLENSSFNLPAIRPKDSSTEVKKSIDKTISFIKNYLGYTKDDENSMESLPFLKLLEDNNERIRLKIIPNNISSTNRIQNQQTHQWLTQTEGLA